MVANNIYFATGTRAPTVMGIGPNGSRAPTTVYTPPLTGGVQQGGSALGPTPSINKGFGIGDQFNRHNENQPIPQHWFLAQHPHGQGSTKVKTSWQHRFRDPELPAELHDFGTNINKAATPYVKP